MYPHAQSYLMSLFEQLDYSQALQVVEALHTLRKCLPSNEGMPIFYSMMVHFYKTPLDLVRLIYTVESHPSPEFIFKIVTQLLDNHQINPGKSIAGFKQLLALLTETATQEKMQLAYAQPPYPDFLTFNQWIDDNTFTTSYAEFSLNPYGKRLQEYQFDLAHYVIQKDKFMLNQPNHVLFSDELGGQLQRQLLTNRSKSIQQLQEEFLHAKRRPEDNKLELTCLIIELLARTT